jgi:hypothetical protein
MTTDVHDIIESTNTGRRGEAPWAAAFYAAIIVAILMVLLRGLWPPEDRLTRESAGVTQVR